MVINIRGDTDYDFSPSPPLFSSIPLEAKQLFPEKLSNKKKLSLVAFSIVFF
jgi:hypothetical protein